MLLSAPPPWAELRIFSRAGLLPGLAGSCERLPALRNLRPWVRRLKVRPENYPVL
jgi:hypothetical protein